MIEQIQILQKAGMHMRKIIICNVTMREALTPLAYRSDNSALRMSEQPVVYPILSCLSGLLSPDDSVKIVLLCKDDPNGNYRRNAEHFKKEFAALCGSVAADPEYKILNTGFDEDRGGTERLLLELAAECEDGAEIISDATYGSKTMPVILLSALSFAVKHLNCRVEHIFYGQVNAAKGEVLVSCDLSDILYDLAD